MKKSFRAILFMLIMALTLSCVAMAAWVEPAENEEGDYIPDLVDFTVTKRPSTIQTKVNFTYGEDDATWLLSAYYSNKHPGMDIKTVHYGEEDEGDTDNMQVYSISSNMPNYVIDKEDNPPYDGINDEAEIVAPTSVNAQTYFMTVQWTDLRDNTYGGKFSVNAELSKKLVSDYNVLAWSNCGVHEYTREPGKV